jgi:hypothetical protein
VIGHGRYDGVYLYEVTEQDLLLGIEGATTYHVGNVLMFADKRKVDLGNEFACAEDIAAAKEYLSHERQQSGQAESAPESDRTESELAALTSRITTQDENVRILTEKIEQRDELLRDLSESLKAQKQDNELLHAQLERARTQLAVDEIKQSELVDDLQHVSAETHTIESTLERVMDEKFRLEQELAERITDLVELNLQNDELRKQLLEPAGASAFMAAAEPGMSKPEATTSAARASEARASAAMPGTEVTTGDPSDTNNAAPDQDVRVLTMASGKRIHVLHEFPTAPKPTFATRTQRAFILAARVVAIMLFAILLLGVASVFATAQVNGISYGMALDLIVDSIRLP